MGLKTGDIVSQKVAPLEYVEGVEARLYSFFNLGARWGGW
jgi:hypothetical protein